LLILVTLVAGVFANAQATFNGFLSTLPVTGLQAARMKVDASGNLYICDANSNKVYKETLSGNTYTLSVVPVTGLIQPLDVAVDSQGNVYVVDPQSQKVFKETLSNGTYTQTTIGTGWSYPEAVAVDVNDNVYVADNTLGGIVKETWIEHIHSYTQSTVVTSNNYDQVDYGIAVDLSGNLYVAEVADSGFQQGLVVEEALSGGVYTEVAVAQNLYIPDAIAVDSSGNVYFNDDSYGTIYKAVPSAGSFTLTMLDSGLVLNEMNFLDGLAVEANGNIDFTDFLPTDDTTNHILRISPSAANFGETGTSFTSSTTMQALFGVNANTTIGSVAVLTQGASGFDFTNFNLAPNAPPATGLCASGTLTYMSFCSVNVSFTPSVAGTRYGAAQLLAAGGAPLATGYVEGLGFGPQLAFLPGSQSTVGYGMLAPEGVAVDGAGNVYIASSGNGAVLMNTLSGGTYSQEPIGTNFYSPSALAVDGAGNIYVADFGGNAVYEDTPDGNLHLQTTISSDLDTPTGVAVDASGNVYIVNAGTQQVLKETLSNGVYTQSVIGSGFISPRGIAVDGKGNVYVSDIFSGSVFVETLSGSTYTQSTIPGSFEDPEGLAVDGVGNVYVADPGLKQVLKESPSGDSYTQSVVPASGLSSPLGVAVDGSGNIYIADSLGNKVFKENFASTPSLSFDPTTVGTTSPDSPLGVTLENIGNDTLYFTIPNSGNNPYVTGDFVYDSGAPGTCPITSPSIPMQGTLAPGAECLMPISFTPLSAGALTGSLLINDNNLDAGAPNYSTQTIPLLGTGVAPTAVLTSPAPGLGTKLGATNVTFQWTTGSGVTEYQLNLGTTAGASNLFLYKGTATSAIAATLPANNVPVYATLYSKINGVWQSNAYEYTEAGTPTPASLTAPTPGLTTILGATNVTFQWTTGTNVTEYQLNLSAIAAGDSDLYSYKGTATSTTVSTIPAYGVKVYAMLYSKINGVWQSNSYVYTESGTPTPAALATPTPGLSTILGTSNVVFQWTSGIDVTDYQLNLSGIAPGDSDLYSYKGTATTTTVATLPANGAKVYARLYSKISGAWQYNDYLYTGGGTPTPAALATPTPGLSTILGTSNVIFQWTSGIDVSDYQLNLSAIAAGDSDLYTYKGTATTTTAATLPANGVKVYARLYSDINGAWQYSDYVYTESGTPTPATLTSPTPGLSTILGTTSVAFQWTAGVAVTDYQLNLSAVAPGDSDLFLYKGTALTTTATTLPANGAKVYARLYSNINGAWQYNDYVYTEQ
jgi:streptogramin lyase